jgi:hypothetical protein
MSAGAEPGSEKYVATGPECDTSSRLYDKSSGIRDGIWRLVQSRSGVQRGR